jgi:hypothetical protein
MEKVLGQNDDKKVVKKRVENATVKGEHPRKGTRAMKRSQMERKAK